MLVFENIIFVYRG